jgi:DNA polymerase V
MMDFDSLSDEELLKKYSDEIVVVGIGAKRSERDLKAIFEITRKRGLDTAIACERAELKIMYLEEYPKGHGHIVQKMINEFEAKIANRNKPEEHAPIEFQTVNGKNHKVDKGTPVFNDNYNPAIMRMAKLMKNASDMMYHIADGESMINARINNGDILLLNTKKKPRKGDIVVASINGRYYVKRFSPEKHGLVLQSENDEYEDFEITEFMEFSILGVVEGKFDLSIG